MNSFSIIEPPTKEFIEMGLRKYGIDPTSYFNNGHPQEDFLLMSKKYPIFVVADGVTLIQFILEKKAYPNPSPAGDVARIFCEQLLKAAEDRYESYTETDTKEIFKIGNEAVRKYNQGQGRTKEVVDFWDNDFFAATAAFVVLKNNTIYWGSICDSYVAHFSSGQCTFRSPDCNAMAEAEAPKFTGDVNDQKAKAIYAWSTKRNGIDVNGRLIGYGVVTGEAAAEQYLNTGMFEVKSGDIVAVFTDGFEDYMSLKELPILLGESFDSIEKRLKEFCKIKSMEDPDKFGHERSLISLQI